MIIHFCHFNEAIMHETMESLFRETCGLGTPLTLEYRNLSQPDQVYATRRFDAPFVLVGRDPRSDLALDDPQVSRRHAFLQVVGGMIYCIDLKSRTKLIWDEEEHSRAHGWIEGGHRVKLGPFELRLPLRLDEKASATELPDPLSVFYAGPKETASITDLGLELPFRAGEYAWVWRLKGSLALLGRSDTCQLTIADDSVSKHHACLIRNPTGLWVVDLHSREGTFVNDVKVRWAWLDLGDVVKIGRLSFKVWYDRRPEGLGRNDIPMTAGAVLPKVPENPAGPGSEISSRRVPPLASQPPAGPSVPMPVSRPSIAALPEQLVLSEELLWEPTIQFGQGPMALWQRQIQAMESFHRDMIMTVQMFFAMHREQHSLVQDELARVEQLTQEVKELQGKLAGLSRSEGSGHGANRNAPASSHSTKQEVVGAATDGVGGMKPPGHSNGKGGQTANGPDPNSTPPVASSSHQDPVTSGPVDLSTESEDAELHQRLTKRIKDLQRERQRYWQRILGAIKK